MALRGPDLVAVQVTTVSSTVSFRNITQQVQEISGLDIEAILQDTQAFGDTYTEQSFVGVRRINEVTLTTLYDDDTTTGVAGIFGAATDVGAERVIKLNIGTTNLYPKFDFIVKNFRRTFNRGALQGAEIVLAPTGAFSLVTT